MAPPSDQKYSQPHTTESKKVLEGFTKNSFTSGGLLLLSGVSPPSSTADHVHYVGQSNFGSDWSATGSTAIFSFTVTVDNFSLVNILFYYCEQVKDGGTKHITSAMLTVTDQNDNITQHAMQLNTNQRDWSPVTTPNFTLAPGLNRIDLSFAVAHWNYLWIGNTYVNEATAIPKPITVSAYWKLISGATVGSGGDHEITTEYTTGIDNSQSHTSSLALELGMSASAKLGEVNVGATSSLTSTDSSTVTFAITETSKKTTKSTYSGDSYGDYWLMQWQPVIIYDIGNGRVVEPADDTVVTTRYPAQPLPPPPPSRPFTRPLGREEDQDENPDFRSDNERDDGGRGGRGDRRRD